MIKLMTYLLLSLVCLLTTGLFALQSNESILSRLRENEGNLDPRYANYVKTEYGSNHIKISINKSSPTAILDILSPVTVSNTPGAPLLRLSYSLFPNSPSYAHYQTPGHWIIQSGSTTGGAVFLQARGGAVQIGSPDSGTATDYTKKVSFSAATTSFNVYAETTNFYKTVIVHHPTSGPTINLYQTLTMVQQSSDMRASEFIDLDNETFRVNPSGNSVIHTTAVSFITDRQGSLYTLDLNSLTKLYDLDIEGTLRFKGSELQLPAGPKTFTLKVDPTSRTLDFGSTDTDASLSKIQTNRMLILNGPEAKKLDFTNVPGTSEIHGIYMLGKAALTAFETGTSTLLLNSRNGFDTVRFGITSNTTTFVDVSGTLEAKKQFIGNGIVPLGGIIMWSGTTIPDGWALCDGRTTLGRLTPDLRDKFLVGASKYADNSIIAVNASLPSPNYSIGNTGGSNAVAITMAQMPSHKHKLYDISSYYSEDTDASGSGGGHSGWFAYPNELTGAAGGDGTRIGAAVPHENRPPYYALAFIMRVK